MTLTLTPRMADMSVFFTINTTFAGSPLSFRVDPVCDRRLPLTDAAAADLHPDLLRFASDFADDHLLVRRTGEFLDAVWDRLGLDNIHDPVDIALTAEQMADWKVTRTDVSRALSRKQGKVATVTSTDEGIRFQTTGFNPMTDGLPVELRT